MNFLNIQSLPTKFEIIVYALSLSFYWTQFAMPLIKSDIISLVFKYHKKKYEDFSRFNKISASIRKERKPFDCMPCMTFWFTFILSGIFGLNAQSFLLLFVGLFVGAITESAIKRYL